MTTYETWLSRQEEARHRPEPEPTCLVCETAVGVAYDVDLSASLCDEHDREFSAWADENPGAYYEDWPVIAPASFVAPNAELDSVLPADGAIAEGYASAHGAGVAIVGAVIMACLAGGFIALLSMPAGTVGQAVVGWGLIGSGLALLARIIKTGALQ
ncbi:hypothetical protein [Xylanimonas protaetiae]|uniref:Uncharacterized protein n=1 Tax=Xylanimonas protaetiae TaxID=2509457 RepID=A0A4V0YG57_9MICO|nr:hypothetical protein [Xylanimonas protaetiae]QAY70051.1 hypothetical protein ET471_08385 [Xylanimonas protaetiae]